MLSMIGEAAYHVTPRPGTGRSVWASARAPKGKFVCVCVLCHEALRFPGQIYPIIGSKKEMMVYLHWLFSSLPKSSKQKFSGVWTSKLLLRLCGSFTGQILHLLTRYLEDLERLRDGWIFMCFCFFSGNRPVKTWKHWILWLYYAFLLVGESGLPTRVASFPLHQPTNQFFVDENNATWKSTRPPGNIEEAIRSDPTISYVGLLYQLKNPNGFLSQKIFLLKWNVNVPTKEVPLGSSKCSEKIFLCLKNKKATGDSPWDFSSAWRCSLRPTRHPNKSSQISRVTGTHRNHVWHHIYLHERLIFMVNVGK